MTEMTIDVYGIEATAELGEIFQNTQWWWHPLWDYCMELHEDIAGAVACGHSSTNDGLDEAGAHQLGLALTFDVWIRRAKKYEVEYRKRIAQIPLRSCEYCRGTGTRRDGKEEASRITGWGSERKLRYLWGELVDGVTAAQPLVR